LPTVDQVACVFCQMPTAIEANLFRYDDSRKIVYINAVANDEFKIIVPTEAREFDET